ncbi:MAG TPA: hypothetical protein VN577_19915 [Terriglobales bacterium]|nr:hypothetical protein [Terriglobales bacterium]
MATSNSLFGRTATTTKRRTPRIGMMLKVGISGTDRLGQKFNATAKATGLNYFGATVSMSYQVAVGAVLSLRNAQRAEAQARVVSYVSAAAGTHTYGVEFVDEATGFWGIHFPVIASS